MSRFHIGAEEDGVAAGVHVTQAGDVFRRFPVLHLRVPQAGADEHRRIGLRFQVVVGRVGEHVGIAVGTRFRVAPFIVFVGGERDTRIQHGGDHVNEGHLREDDAVIFWRHVADGPHQQAASAAAQRRNAVFRSVLVFNEVTRDVDEVGKGVLFVQQFAVFIPFTPHFLAATYVRQRIDHATVKQADGAGTEARIHREAIAAVAILQECRRAVALEILAVHQRDRHFRAITHRYP